jgi:CheY-like chemotaxis protein
MDASSNGPERARPNMEQQLDAATLGQQVLRLGLVTEDQLAQAHDEVGPRNHDANALLLALERKGVLTPWQSGKLVKGDVDGYILGGYRLLYKIASGTFGRVYRADDPRTGRVVAVKVLRRRWSEDEQKINLFIREGKVGLTLKHPNIVEVLAMSQDPASGQYYIVMEFVEGANLRDILQIRKKLQPHEALRIVEDSASGLAHAYSRGITHRDVKPTNLLISSQGEAKLVDFGLAQLMMSMANIDREKVERTVDYAGLEKATGVPMGDVRSDIYFLGCCLFQMLTGRSPLVITRDRYARMQKRRFDNVETIRPGEVEAPPAVFALLDTMMALAPQRRYQTPSQLLDSLRAARRELAGHAAKAANGTITRSVFVVEKNERLQDALREGLKESGYRVFMAADPVRALDRFRQQPYDALVVDAETTGEEGVLVFEHILAEAGRRHIPLAAILVLAQEQAAWAERVPPTPRMAVLVRPGVTFKQLLHKLAELLKE